MDVVTVTLPTSDTKKDLVVLLHVPVQRIVVVRRKCTEGAQQSLLCVHTSNMGIHSGLGPFRGNVTVTTSILDSLPPETNMYWFLYNLLRLYFCLHIHRLLLLLLLLLLNLLLNRCRWGGCCMCLHILQKLRQLPHTDLRTCPLELYPPLCDQLVASGYCTNCCKLQKVHVF